MNINSFGHSLAFQFGPNAQQTLQIARALIEEDSTETSDQLAAMLDSGTITANTPSGDNGENLLMYAVKQYALFSFLDMVEHASAEHLDLNVTDWNGNSAWHWIALHLHDDEFFGGGGWPNQLDDLLAEHPQIQIDWTLRNGDDNTPLDVAKNLGKTQLAAWITKQMESPPTHPMEVDWE